ncbi:MAG: tyrosine-type recombinase/integrase [Propionibacteriaceae bacterium]|nr:tyrosine-type recombinase/integrase [Propionibacteriaceae bacterium]
MEDDDVPHVENESQYHWYMPALPFDEGLEDVLAAWKRHALAAGHSDRTITSREYTIRRLAACGIDPMSATRDELTDWLASLMDSRTGAPAKRSTKATYRAQLRAFYVWVVDTGRVQENPADRLPTPKPGRGVPRPVTPAQVRMILDACSDPRAATTRSYVLLSAYAGLRVHEVARVRGEDVLGSELLVQGKGGTSLTVPMHPLLVDLAQRMPLSGWWFPSSSTRGYVDRSSVSSAIKRAMVRAGVPGTPHALRHHFGTQVLISSGGDLRTTQRALRHASPATTAIYTQVPDAALAQGVSGIPAA